MSNQIVPGIGADLANVCNEVSRMFEKIAEHYVAVEQQLLVEHERHRIALDRYAAGDNSARNEINAAASLLKKLDARCDEVTMLDNEIGKTLLRLENELSRKLREWSALAKC